MPFQMLKKLRVKEVNYYECFNDKQKIVVCSAVGHLFVLGEKGGESWKYPVFDTEWRPLHKVSKANAYVKGYIDTLKSLKKDSVEIVVATDFDIEGEVIGYNVIKQIYGIENSSRMKFSSLTKESILNAFNSRQKTIEVGQKEAGLTRHNLDWFYGINLSRAFTSSIKTASNKFKVLSTGRVQAPALHFLCDKEKEISKFISQKYYEIYLDGKIKNKKIKAQYFDETKKEEIEEDDKDKNQKLQNDKYKLLDEKKVKEIIKSCQNKDGTIYDINSKKFKQSVPVPFDLTTLQMEASNVFGLSPKRTLEIAQKLYIEGLTSYPRTSSQKFKDTDLKAILKKLEKMPNYKSLVLKVYDVNKKLIPKEGRKDDPAHPCFTEDHILSFYNSKKKIKDIIKNIDDWKLDKQKNSFYKNISLEEVFSFDDINKKICKNTPYKIWKTEFNDKLINIKIDCENLKVTKNHKFLVFDEEGLKYKKSEEIKENDYLFFNDFKEKFSKDIKLKFSDKEILESFSKKNQIDIKNKK